MISKPTLSDYTEKEFLEFLNEFINEKPEMSDEEHEAYIDQLVEHFESVTEHPSGSDLLFYPDKTREDSPRGVLEEVKAWRAAHGKPGFKPE